MSNITRANNSYGLNQPINLDAPYPIVSKRAPTTADKAPIGQEWVVPSTNAVYFLSSIVNNSANWVNVGGGAGVFTSLTVTPGPINLTGAFTLVAGTNAVHFADDAANHAVTIGSQTGASQLTLNAGTSGIALDAVGSLLTATSQFETAASPTATLAFTGTIGTANFTGFTTAAAASQDFIIQQASITTTSGILISANNTGANDAKMTIERILPAAGSVTVTLVNNGTQALNGNVNINFWLYTF